MPNLRGFTPQQNPEWITLDFDDGSSSHPIHDPTSSYRAEVAAIVPRVMGGTPPDPMAGALAQNDPPPGPAPAVATDAAPPNPWQRLTDRAPIPGVGMRPGAAGAPAAPAAPAAPIALGGNPPPLPSGKPLSASERAPLEPTDDEVRKLVPSAVPFDGRPAGSARSTAPAPLPAYQAPPGLVRAGAVVSSTGLSDADKARVDEASARASKSAAEANEADYVARANQFFTDWQRLGADAQRQLAEKNALEQQEREFNQRVQAQRQRNAERAARPIDIAEAVEGEAGAYAFMAAIGDAISNFGAALQGRGPVADPSDRIAGIINRYVQIQTAQKQADLEAGRITADQLEADREFVRFKIATAAKQLLETEEKRAHTASEYKALGVLKKRMEQEQANADAKNAAATARQETVQQQFAPPAPSTTWAPNDDESRALKALLGPDWEKKYVAGMNAPVQAGQNAPTVQMALPMLHEMDEDLQTLKDLAEANGGTIPTRGVINVPEILRSRMAKMGWEPGMAAEQANQLMTGYVLRKARSYGGAVTEPDYANAEKEFGQTGDGFIRGIQRMRDSVNNGVRQAAMTHFRGAAQPVLDISTKGYGRSTGVKQPEATSFGKKAVENTGPAAPDDRSPGWLARQQAREEAEAAERDRKRREAPPPPREQRVPTMGRGAVRF